MAANIESTPRTLTCFLSNSFADSDIAQIVHEILSDLNVQVRTSADLPLGSGVASSIVDEILSVDFVCIVLASKVDSAALWYEAGIAAGSRRPLLIVGEDKALDNLSFNPFSAPIIRYRHNSTKVLRETLAVYLRQVQPIAAQLKISWDRIDETAGPAATISPEKRDIPTERETQARVVDHLVQLGIPTGAYRQIGPRKTVDALIGFPALGDEFNTIIIEIRQDRSSEKRDIDRVLDYMAAAGARLAILVYERNQNMKPQIHISGSFGLILISADELLSWDYERIGRELSRLRNQIIHSS